MYMYILLFTINAGAIASHLGLILDATERREVATPAAYPTISTVVIFSVNL